MQIVEDQFTDIAGGEHHLRARKHKETNYFAVYFAEQYTTADTAEEAFNWVYWSINHNLPHAFVSKSVEKQAAVLDWIRAHLRPGTRGKAKRYSSYYLKHVVERAIDAYVGNGELKGAMLQAGYIPPVGTDMYDINWDFVLERGLPEKLDSRR